MKYARKVVVDAFQLPSDDAEIGKFHEWAREHNFVSWTSAHHGTMDVETNAGLTSAGEGDWIVKMPDGTFTVFAKDEFLEYYTPVDLTTDGAMFRWFFGRMIDSITAMRQGAEEHEDAAVIWLMQQFESNGLSRAIDIDTVRGLFKEAMQK